jgi:hypothetical protein
MAAAAVAAYAASRRAAAIQERRHDRPHFVQQHVASGHHTTRRVAMAITFRPEQLTSFGVCLLDGSYQYTTAQGQTSLFNLIHRS